MLQCPLCAKIPATCLTQEGVHQALINLGYYRCTVKNIHVKPVILPDIAAAPEETPPAAQC